MTVCGLPCQQGEANAILKCSLCAADSFWARYIMPLQQLTELLQDLNTLESST
jgi:hypothetical protein